MGHSHIRTTDRFLQSTDDRKVEALERQDLAGILSIIPQSRKPIPETKRFFNQRPTWDLGAKNHWIEKE